MNRNSRARCVSEPVLRSTRTCRKVRKFAMWSIAVCAAIQLLIEASVWNVTCVIIVLITSLITLHFVVRAKIIRAAPLPVLVVIGFNIATMSGALVAQTLDLRALVFNLQVPEITFIACALFQVSLLAALIIFASSSMFSSVSEKINSRILRPMGLMRAPSPGQLWLMGLLGSAILAWTSMVMYSDDGVQYGDVGDKFLFGLTYLSFGPFLLPILATAFPEAGKFNSENKGRRKWLLIIYLLCLLLFAIARNSRATFAVGIANLSIGVGLLVLLGQLRVPQKLRRRLVIGAMFLMAAMPSLSDLAIAMVVVRGERGTISSMELVQRTLEAFQDKRTLQEYRRVSAISSSASEYEESYLSNPFLARFVQTKFFDNTLALKEVRTGQHAEALWDITIDKMIALLPTPILRFFGENLDKTRLEFSMGDAMYYMQYGTGLGGYRVGSPIGHGLGLMGYFLYIAIIPLFIVVFVALNSLTTSSIGVVVISPIVLLQLISIYYLACGDSLLALPTMILRTLPQNILTYWLVFHVTRWITGFNRPKFLAVNL